VTGDRQKQIFGGNEAEMLTSLRAEMLSSSPQIVTPNLAKIRPKTIAKRY